MKYGKFVHVVEFDNDEMEKIKSILSNEEKKIKEGIAVGKSEDRISKIAWCHNSELRKLLFNIAVQANIDSQWYLNIITCEPVQYTLYDVEGAKYDWHIDQSPPTIYPEGFFGCRKISMTLFLNDPEEYEGGEFDLEVFAPNHPERIQTFKLKKGQAIFFHSDFWHRVRPIKSGIRKTLVAWFSGTPYV